MDDRQIEKLNSFMKSQDVLEDHSAVINPLLVALPAMKTTFDGIITGISTEGGFGEVDLTGVSEDKANKRTDLEEITLKISRSAEAYYMTLNDRANMKKVHFNPSKLSSMRGIQLYAAAKRLYQQVLPVQANLINALPADVTLLNTTNEEFFNLEIEPKRQTEERKVHNDAIDPLIQEGDEVRNNINILMSTIADTQPAIYDQWALSLSIDSTGANTSVALTLEGSVTPGQVVNLDYSSLTLAGNTEIKLFNLGSTDLRIGFSTANNTLGNQSLTVIAGDDERVTAASLNYNPGQGNTFLNLKNQTASAVDYKVEFYLMD